MNKLAIDESMEKLIEEGMPFELIDGENLEFKGELMSSVLSKTPDDNIFVVAVIGP
jgi:hypothetical protein